MINSLLSEISNNFIKLSKDHSDTILKAANLIIMSLENGGKVMFCGNGGSAADSQHLSAELVGRYRRNREPLASISLTTDTSAITAIGNDFSFDDIFSRQVESIGKNSDVLYAISTSGKSKNIINAINAAKKNKIKVIGITGQDGGHMKSKCDILINVPAKRTDRIQEMHIAVGQIICQVIEDHFFK